MSNKKINSINDLFALAKPQQIAADLDKHQRTIDRWREAGVPESYHIKLAKLYGVDPLDLYKLSLKIRGYGRRN